jgi:hypothetical protein
MCTTRKEFQRNSQFFKIFQELATNNNRNLNNFMDKIFLIRFKTDLLCRQIGFSISHSRITIIKAVEKI